MSDNAATITFDYEKIKKFLEDISNRTGDIETRKDSVINAIFSSVVYRDVIRHFQDERGPEGRWQSWSRRYAKQMEKIGKGGNKKLQDTGRLRQSFLPGNWRDEFETLIWYNNAKTKKGFPYAKAHDEGGPTLPQRSFMWLSNDAIDDILNNILKHVTKS